MDAAQRLRATYEFGPVDRLVRREFSIWPEAVERWKGEGMPEGVSEAEVFGFDEPGSAGVWRGFRIGRIISTIFFLSRRMR